MRKLIVAAALLVPVITFVSNVVTGATTHRAGSGFSGTPAVIAQPGTVAPNSAVADPVYKKLGK